MGGHVFDHGAERRSVFSTGILVVSLGALAAAGLGLWIRRTSAVEAGGAPAPAESTAPDGAGFALEISLIDAAAAGELALVEAHLARGADIDVRDAQGESALSAAVRFGHVAVARVLLDAGAKLETKSGREPELHLAALADDPESIVMLLRAGARTGTRDAEGATALHLASERGHEQTALALLDAGANVNARDGSGFTPLARAVLLARLALVNTLLARGADVQLVDQQQRAPLALAAAQGDLDVVRQLLAAGADPRAADATGWTALHEAAAQGRADVVLLLAGRMDRTSLGARTSRGASALHLAARNGDAQCVELLLAARLDPQWRDADDRVARDLAPPGLEGEPWTSLGPTSTASAPKRPNPVMLDTDRRRPTICITSRTAKSRSGAVSRLDLAVWEDGAMLFAPWSTGGEVEYRAAVLPAEVVASALRDVEETGWLELPAPPVRPDDRNCVEAAIEHRGTWVRRMWNDVDVPGAGDDGRAAYADWALRKAKVEDILRSLRPAASQSLSFALVRGSFRGISFDDGVRASWLK